MQTHIEKPKVPWWHWHRHLYNWVIHFADTKHGAIALFVLSFAESSFFPVPPDVLLAPLTLGAPKKWFRFALLCSIASVLGGIAGYMIGLFLWAYVGGFFHNHVPGFQWDKIQTNYGNTITGEIRSNSIKTEGMKPFPKYPLIITSSDGKQFSYESKDVNSVEINPFSTVGALYAKWDWITVAVAGFTPLPYKVITITAGVFKINFLIFIIASALSRSARFFLVAGLFGWKGEAMRPFVEKYFNLLTLAFVLLLIGGFMAIKFL